jgi:hypothetical protein
MKIEINGVVTRHILTPQTATTQTQTRDLMTSDINQEDIIETVKIAFTVYEAVKILIASIKNIFKK